MEIEDEETKVVRVEKIRIHYDILPKYCTRCKVQGHGDADCRIVHPELRRNFVNKGKEKVLNDTDKTTSREEDNKKNRYYKRTLTGGKTGANS